MEITKEQKEAIEYSKNCLMKITLGIDCEFDVNILNTLLNLIKKLQKENEELTISNKEIDKECSRLEKKEVELINENEHYKDLIYALETYYEITEEDLEKCMKNDR